jgi:hypothetical protein
LAAPVRQGLRKLIPGVLAAVLSAPGWAANDADHHAHHHAAGTDGSIVMNANPDTLPNGCDAVSGDEAVTIHAGRDFAADVPGALFGMSRHEVRVAPCTRLTVTLVNDDDVRHQWMVHGLPKYLYPAGMFHIEAMGGGQATGTFIVPAEDRTYLIHCDIAQHMEKGMRGQLVVGAGSGDLWAVPGISDAFRRDDYLPGEGRTAVVFTVALAVGFAVGWLLYRRRPRRRQAQEQS